MKRTNPNSALGALHVKIPTYINRHIQENKIN